MQDFKDIGIQPDLVLRVSHEKQRDHLELNFHLEVRNRSLGLEIQERSYPRVQIAGRFEDVLSEYFEELQDLDPLARGETSRLAPAIYSKGILLGERLLPPALRAQLWALRERRPPASLFLLSDETWIPWEWIRLREPLDHESNFLVEITENLEEETPEVLLSQGRFLVELFSWTRWLNHLPQRLELPMRRVGLIFPEISRTEDTDEEQRELQRLLDAEILAPNAPDVLRHLEDIAHDGFHFTGHALIPYAGSRSADQTQLQLDGSTLRADELAESSRHLTRRRPWIFLNGCHSARGLYSLNGRGGFAQAFLMAGAGAFLGTHWQVPDKAAKDFALAVYEYFISGRPLGESVRLAREWFSRIHPGDPTFLAYAVFGHPLAVRNERMSRWSLEHLPLQIPTRTWNGQQDPPAALLKAEYQIVPFLGRAQECKRLEAWCDDASTLGVQLITGKGGMGKTRLLIEMAQQRQKAGWLSGFLIKDEADRAPAAAWQILASQDKPLFLVIDYAEARVDFVVELLKAILKRRLDHSIPKTRCVLLSRHAGDWWDEIRREGQGVGAFLQGPATLHLSLQSPNVDRRVSFATASESFEKILGPARTPTPEIDFAQRSWLEKEDIYERVLFIQMRALMALEDQEPDPDEEKSAILDFLLLREERFWTRIAQSRSLSRQLVPGIRRALGLFTMGGGAKTRLEAVRTLQRIQFFNDVPHQEIEAVADVLHAAYADAQNFIAPLQPDLLGQHLTFREMQLHPEEFADFI